MCALAQALNEYDTKLAGSVDFRQKLEAQTASVLATEVKNNANKLARWTAEAVLAGAHELKLGFVARTTPKDNTRHQVGALLYVLSWRKSSVSSSDHTCLFPASAFDSCVACLFAAHWSVLPRAGGGREALQDPAVCAAAQL